MKHNQMRQVVFPILAAFIWGTSFVSQDICADSMGAFTFMGWIFHWMVLSVSVPSGHTYPSFRRRVMVYSPTSVALSSPDTV